MQLIPPEFFAAYQEYDREITIRKTRLGCFLGIVMVPLFGGLDYFVYPKLAYSFFLLRLLCSLMMAGLYLVLATDFGKKYYHAQGIVLLFLPSAVIAWMIYATEGAASPYYAGLTLVMMVLAVVLDWTFWQSVISVILVLFLYLAASVPSLSGNVGIFLNNLFFLVATGITIITGTYFHSRVRIREFVSRCELDKSRAALEVSLVQLKENEMQLVQSEKLTSLGRFSAGLMHDILNPLNYSRTGTFTLRKKSRDLPPELRKTFEEILTDIDDGLKRVDNIVSDLRTFTHPGGQAAEDTDIADTFNIALRFVSSEVKEKNVAVELELEAGQKAWISRNHLVLVLVNMLENSLDALGEKKFFGGVRPVIQISSRTEKGRSLVFIRDNGPGIDPKIMAKIFDPFYTTKDVGKGTGLGLSICFGIMNSYSGSIAAASEPGEFCEFTLDLPATEFAVKTISNNAEPIRL